MVTVLFADIRGFTDFLRAAHSRPKCRALQRLLPGCDPADRGRGRVIDKFIGDRIDGPVRRNPRSSDHAEAAVRAALAIVRVSRQSSFLAPHGFRGLRIGIGIHTGPVLLGAVGTATRLDFTAVGDTVNAAVRVEGENKRIGSSILITGELRSPVTRTSGPIGDLWRSPDGDCEGKQAELSLYVVEERRQVSPIILRKPNPRSPRKAPKMVLHSLALPCHSWRLKSPNPWRWS